MNVNLGSGHGEGDYNTGGRAASEVLPLQKNGGGGAVKFKP